MWFWFEITSAFSSNWTILGENFITILECLLFLHLSEVSWILKMDDPFMNWGGKLVKSLDWIRSNSCILNSGDRGRTPWYRYARLCVFTRSSLCLLCHCHQVQNTAICTHPVVGAWKIFHASADQFLILGRFSLGLMTT